VDVVLVGADGVAEVPLLQVGARLHVVETAIPDNF
jgi:hypothetical protein